MTIPSDIRRAARNVLAREELARLRASNWPAPAALGKGFKRGAHGNHIIETPDGKFHSKAEYARWIELKRQRDAGQIRDLKRQVKFSLVVNEVLIADYFADYTYYLNGKYVVEDCKGHATAIYKLKKKLMKACHEIDIYEFKVGRRTTKRRSALRVAKPGKRLKKRLKG